jgi:hypothetical protein
MLAGGVAVPFFFIKKMHFGIPRQEVIGTQEQKQERRIAPYSLFLHCACLRDPS